MGTEGGEVISAELLSAGSVAWREGMLVRKLSAEIGNATGLGWVEVELEPLMAGAEVIDLKAPVAFVTFVTEFPSFCQDSW